MKECDRMGKIEKYISQIKNITAALSLVFHTGMVAVWRERMN